VLTAVARAGARILGHHLCDWKLQPSDVLTDRAIMGDGVADVAGITRAARRAGYSGLLEIEIFSQGDLWRRPPREVASLCLERALDCLADAGQG
jgi:sugar phosphate isomerase/epimerase